MHLTHRKRSQCHSVNKISLLYPEAFDRKLRMRAIKASPGGKLAPQATEGECEYFGLRAFHPSGQPYRFARQSPSVALRQLPPGGRLCSASPPGLQALMGSFNLMTFSPQWNEVDRGTRKTSIILTLFFQEPTNLICIKAKISPAKAGHVRMITVILIPIRPNGDRLGFRV